MSDIAYVRLERAFVVLGVVLDVLSRKVIAYTIGPTPDALIPLAALEDATESRQPPRGRVHHSDLLSQYSFRRYRERLAIAGLRGSMSRAANPCNNSQANSFMKTVKHKDIYPCEYRTIAVVIVRLPNFLEQIYNNNRQSSAINSRSPNAFEADHALNLSSGQIATP